MFCDAEQSGRSIPMFLRLVNTITVLRSYLNVSCLSHDGGKFNLSTVVYLCHSWPTHTARCTDDVGSLTCEALNSHTYGIFCSCFSMSRVSLALNTLSARIWVSFFLWSSASVQIGSNGSTQVWIGKNLEVVMALSRYMRYSPGRKKRYRTTNILSVPVTYRSFKPWTSKKWC